ncbi:MAG: VWA domain-containing protein [Anaerolineae bacterium]|nr:VWA domain-containing protein [Anaerolineae bacterium]
MSEFRFAEPLFLLLIPTVAIFLWINHRSRLIPAPASFLYPDIRLMGRVADTWRVRLHHLPTLLAIMGVILLIVALARPQTGDTREVIRGQGVAIVLAVDISESMSAPDFAPENRLQAAKRVMGQFISQREFDSIGLVIFARNAFHQAPLTLNYPILLQLLDNIRLASQLQGQQDGTALGLGLASAVNMLRDSESASKVVILLTDGANNAGIDPIQVALATRALGIRVYAIGMGDADITSDLDEETLSQIATITNGLYYRAEDTDGLRVIYDRINRLERSDAERDSFVQWRDVGRIILLPALIVLILAQILRYSVFQYTIG